MIKLTNHIAMSGTTPTDELEENALKRQLDAIRKDLKIELLKAIVAYRAVFIAVEGCGKAQQPLLDHATNKVRDLQLALGFELLPYWKCVDDGFDGNLSCFAHQPHD